MSQQQGPLDYEPPGRKQTLGSSIVCPACGGNETVRGTLVGGEEWHFFPSGLKASLTSGLQVEAWAYACLSCGVTTTIVHPPELRKLLGWKSPDDDAG